jgi:hypothetical protein
VKFGGLLAEPEQESAETTFVEAEAATKSEKLDEINRALIKLERVAGQLTSAMLNPTANEVNTET